MGKFTDGLISFASKIVNQRTATGQNGFAVRLLSNAEKRAIYLTGIGNKIVRLKAGYALKNTLQFETTEDEKFYRKRLARHVKEAASWMVGMGRGVIVLHERGDNLAEPMRAFNPDRGHFSVFGGDMVDVMRAETDLQSPRYYKPVVYAVRGIPVHHTRVIDFTYVKPPEVDAPLYQYGGVGEFDLIYDQLVADGVVQRASPRILEKASTLFYKVKGFKDAMRSGNESDMVKYFGKLEDVRGIYSAGLIDAEDELEIVTQTLTNLSDADQITLRRLAMVTGIPLALLVGENVKGLNSTGDNERQIFQEMIETVQSDYLIEPISALMRKCDRGDIEFKDNQGETAIGRVQYDNQVIENASLLFQMGEDYSTYLEEKGIAKPDPFARFFEGVDDGEA